MYCVTEAKTEVVRGQGCSSVKSSYAHICSLGHSVNSVTQKKILAQDHDIIAVSYVQQSEQH